MILFQTYKYLKSCSHGIWDNAFEMSYVDNPSFSLLHRRTVSSPSLLNLNVTTTRPTYVQHEIGLSPTFIMNWWRFGFWIVLAAIYGQVLSVRQERMTNKHLRITHEPWPPFLTRKENVDGSVSLEGPVGEAIMFWQKARNFTFTLVRPPDGLWGYCPEPNNCSGMIGQVNRKEVDFAIGKTKFYSLNLRYYHND